ncbi:HpcH/HpaI aldolase/citrate lyase family protein [Nonomuraea sp. NPDC050153]|uniref:HpcH/HpaI aldolase/citrate lyase family protein n=1 Tax=Nonomuraea sp. NPDC050153 TaxID=3364359 RepID=UPI0037B83312
MRNPPRRIRTKLERGESVFGVTVQLPSPESVEIAGYAGYDFAWIDAEHGTMGISDINHLVRAADAVGIDSIVRVPDHSASFIQRVLDTGATGIMAPHIRTLVEAKSVVEAARFAPRGVRGACPATRAVGHLTEDWYGDYVRADQDVLVFGLIEDVEGVENVEEIVRHSGIDGILCGPFDLAMSLGLHGDVTDPRVTDMQTRVAHAARDAGLQYVAISGWEKRSTERLVEDGVRIFNVSGDRGVLHIEFKKALAQAAAAVAAAGKPEAVAS